MTDEADSDPPGLFSFEGFSFLPASAAFSLFSTTSSLLTVLASHHLPRGLPGKDALLLIFMLAALFVSAIGADVLIVRGLSQAGTLRILGWSVSGRRLGWAFLACYLAPWSVITVVFILAGTVR